MNPPGIDIDNRLLELDQALTEHPERDLCSFVEGWAIEDYAALYLRDLSQYPYLAMRLPRMPSPEIQRYWTGADGAILMKQSIDFTRTLKTEYEAIANEVLSGAAVLDYGAGWGRITRMLLQFIPRHQISTCDAWASSTELFNSLGFGIMCDTIDSIPDALPYLDEQFDLVFLFSVLTHLPESAVRPVMSAIQRIVKATGIVVVTIRPVTFWTWVNDSDMASRHARVGFAHRTHGTGNGEEWGDTSMSLDWLARHCVNWKIRKSLINESDSLQQVVFLTKR